MTKAHENYQHTLFLILCACCLLLRFSEWDVRVELRDGRLEPVAKANVINWFSPTICLTWCQGELLNLASSAELLGLTWVMRVSLQFLPIILFFWLLFFGLLRSLSKATSFTGRTAVSYRQRSEETSWLGSVGVHWNPILSEEIQVVIVHIEELIKFLDIMFRLLTEDIWLLLDLLSISFSLESSRELAWSLWIVSFAFLLCHCSQC